ncbi:ATP-binding protein [Myxococcus sp. SDU36]|uniref:AAA family ATPase n=1 Tax=Myxococcus sp. SDU36 TaxID=2831967 RepID=UPI002543BB34|nr:ATP-binding protein [Myxococcus sp. SDU36]WIG94605.1 AAA family ATPase [Myxococcus sp. SDU36]
MIEKVQFRNFKAYRSLDLELEPFTVLVGPNASGKTTLLEGLSLFSEITTHLFSAPKRDSSWRMPLVQAHGTTGAIEVGVSGKWGTVDGSVNIIGIPEPVPANPTIQPSLTIDSLLAGSPFKISLKPRNGNWLAMAKEDLANIDFHWDMERPSLTQFLAGVSATSILRFIPRMLAAASYSDAAVPSLSSDGSGLASVLAYLKLSQDEVFTEIEQALKQIVPAVRRIRIERAAVEQTAVRTIALDDQKHEVPETRTLWGNQVVFDMKGAKGVAPDSAGEGTLMVLGLLTALMGPSKPRLVLLDDIELSLHPAAQSRLIAALRAIQKRDPELQIIATSHSPFILNDLDPKEVRMTFLAENGFARCEKLTAHPEFEKWKGLMAPGEFWSSVGEDWIGKLGEATPNE